MNHEIIISAEVECSAEVVDHIRSSICAALEAQGVPLACEINVMVTNDEGIRAINGSMRGLDAATDVLSFPMFDMPAGSFPSIGWTDPDTGLLPLGDMCVSLERAVAQAGEFGHSVERELCYLTVHSVLHLLGYDHMDEGPQKAQMREREEAILGAMGITR